MKELLAALFGSVATAVLLFLGWGMGSEKADGPFAPAPFDVASFCVMADVLTLGPAIDLTSIERIAIKGKEQVNWKDDGSNRLATRYYFVEGEQQDEVVEVFDNAVGCMRGAR